MLEVSNIYKEYEGSPLLKGISFSVNRGETVCLLGRSGSGKSTLLRLIAGLEKADAGQIFWNGEDIEAIPIHKRNFGLMFQDYALFPHRTVAENVAFGLRMKGSSREVIHSVVTASLKRVNLTRFADRRVTDLSGGEQQRVALARALAPEPKLLMLDEPLGALDRTLREQLVQELRQILHETEIPTIYGTHDQEEAFTIADQCIMLHEGKIEQSGTPEEVYLHPKSVWVADFLGLDNLLDGKVRSLRPLQFETELGIVEAKMPDDHALNIGDQAQLLIPPTGIQLKADSENENRLAGIVRDCVFRGSDYRISCEFAGKYRFDFYLPNAYKIGQSIELIIDPTRVICL